MDNGAADFVLTQIVFDANEFIEFVSKCRSMGIQVPIIAGILPVYSPDSARRISQQCKIHMPTKLIDFLERNNEQANIEFSVNYFADLCRTIVESRSTFGLHFYTMNDFKLVESIQSMLSNDSSV